MREACRPAEDDGEQTSPEATTVHRRSIPTSAASYSPTLVGTEASPRSVTKGEPPAGRASLARAEQGPGKILADRGRVRHSAYISAEEVASLHRPHVLEIKGGSEAGQLGPLGGSTAPPYGARVEQENLRVIHQQPVRMESSMDPARAVEAGERLRQPHNAASAKVRVPEDSGRPELTDGGGVHPLRDRPAWTLTALWLGETEYGGRRYAKGPQAVGPSMRGSGLRTMAPSAPLEAVEASGPDLAAREVNANLLAVSGVPSAHARRENGLEDIGGLQK